MRASSFSPRTCSGDMYAAVPRAMPVRVRLRYAASRRGRVVSKESVVL